MCVCVCVCVCVCCVCVCVHVCACVCVCVHVCVCVCVHVCVCVCVWQFSITIFNTASVPLSSGCCFSITEQLFQLRPLDPQTIHSVVISYASRQYTCLVCSDDWRNYLRGGMGRGGHGN